MEKPKRTRKPKGTKPTPDPNATAPAPQGWHLTWMVPKRG